MYKKYVLLSTYLDNKFKHRFITWYLKKLTLVNEESAEESIRILIDTFNMYNPHKHKFRSDELNLFLS